MIRFAVILIALLSGSGAAWLALKATWREPPEATTIMIEEPKVDVLTPNVDLKRGARLSAKHLIWTRWPETQVSGGMILRSNSPDAIGELAGRVLRSNLYSGEPIREPHLATGDGGFLATILQPGMRAIGFRVSEEITAGGFVLPNDRVDVLHTVVRDLDGDGTATGATRTILTNVRVLAIGQSALGTDALVLDDAGPKASRDEALTGETATLEVSGAQAEALMSAEASGRLSLALRAADDFDLSGIGDLTMIEGNRVNHMGPPSGPDTDLEDMSARQHEVRVISAGISEIVLTAARVTR